MKTCQRCNEPMLEGERLAPYHDFPTMHWECGLRAVCGGVNHLLKQCTCCGGTLPPDPESLTRRQAAQVAAAVFLVLNPPFQLDNNED